MTVLHRCFNYLQAI